MILSKISSLCSKLKQWFIKLGFWKKLIIIFTINTLIILIVMNVLMEILFGQVNSNISSISATETQQYISISNSLVGVSIVNSLFAGVQIYCDFIVQLDSSHHFFSNRPNIYKSLLSGQPPYNPPLAQNFQSEPDFRQPVIYFYSSNSTFQNQPYLNVLLSSLLGQNQQQGIKRINIIYQSLSNPTDIFVTTLPGTNDFTIPSVQDISIRYNGLTKDYITVAGIYTDSLTKSENKSYIFSFRTVQFIQNFRILTQVQIYQQTLRSFFDKTYYYPSTQIVIFQILSDNPRTYRLTNLNYFELDLTHCFNHAYHQFVLSNGTTLSAYSIGLTESFQIGQNPFIISEQQIMNMTSYIGQYRLVMIVDTLQLSTPNNFMTGFLSRQSSTLSYVIYGWSFVILLATVGLSIVTGNYIFYNLKTLSEKLQEYTKFPQKINRIIFALKELQCTGIIKKLIDNVATIIQKIEQRKKNKNQYISPMIYPLNFAQKQFSLKHDLNDQQKWQQWKNCLTIAKQRMLSQKHSIANKKHNNEEKYHSRKQSMKPHEL